MEDKRREGAEKYASERYYSYEESDSDRQIAIGGHEAGQDEGFEEALRRLCGQEAEVKAKEWKKIGLEPTSVEWARWLRETRWE